MPPVAQKPVLPADRGSPARIARVEVPADAIVYTPPVPLLPADAARGTQSAGPEQPVQPVVTPNGVRSRGTAAAALANRVGEAGRAAPKPKTEQAVPNQGKRERVTGSARANLFLLASRDQQTKRQRVSIDQQLQPLSSVTAGLS